MVTKTLKDLTGMVGMLPIKSDILDINVVKDEAIKWVKEDETAYWKLHEDDRPIWRILTGRWMKRLNITEDDLKEVEDGN